MLLPVKTISSLSEMSDWMCKRMRCEWPRIWQMAGDNMAPIKWLGIPILSVGSDGSGLM
jgi:hypothetical protein